MQLRRLPLFLLRKRRLVLFIKHRGDFLAGAGCGELQGLIDVNIALGHTLSGMAKEGPDRQFREAKIAGDATERVPQCIRRNAFDADAGALAAVKCSSVISDGKT